MNRFVKGIINPKIEVNMSLSLQRLIDNIAEVD